MRNQALRKRIKDSGLYFWQVAEEIGITATTFTVWLRRELTPDRLERVESAIASLIDKKEGVKHGSN